MGQANGETSGGFVRLFLLVGNRLLRDTLLRLFRKPADIYVVGQGAPALTTSSDVEQSECDIVLMDSFTPNIPPNDPLFGDAAKTFRAEILLVGMNDDEEEFLSAVQAGSCGYLLKDASAGEVLGAVRAISRGEAVCPPKLCLSLFRWVSSDAREESKKGEAKPNLTLRQQQLVSLVAKGMTNKEIASELNLSEFTVKNHIHRIMKQVDAESRHEAVETVRAHGYPVNNEG